MCNQYAIVLQTASAAVTHHERGIYVVRFFRIRCSIDGVPAKDFELVSDFSAVAQTRSVHRERV